MTVPAVLDAAGRRRSPATMPGYHAGRPPRTKGQLYPADPPTVEEIVAVMCEASDDRHGWRLRALIGGSGAAACASRRRSRSANATSIPGAAHCSCATARAVGGARSAWTPGASSSCGPGLRLASSSQSARCCVSSTAPLADDRGRAPTCASSFAGSPPRPVSGAASRRISCAIPTPSSLRAKAWRST
jgi:hypothetical protein